MVITPTFEQIKQAVLEKLQMLDPRLTYHRLEHTLDVLEQAERIALEEGLEDPQSLLLLKVASLYHDTGFLQTYFNHEEKSCEIFLMDADRFGFDEQEKQVVVQLIMATRIPQRPGTLLERILCDADLDYLGRNDFLSIGNSLKNELLLYNVISNEQEWDQLQLNFLSHHFYHTNASQQQREPFKKKNIEQLT